MTLRRAAIILAVALLLLLISVHHALTTPWHPTEQQMLEGMAKPLKQSTQPLGARTWRA